MSLKCMGKRSSKLYILMPTEYLIQNDKTMRMIKVVKCKLW